MVTGLGLGITASGHKFAAAVATNSWDLDYAQYERISFDTTAQDTLNRGFYIKPDGTKLYTIGTTGDDVYQYSLSIAWDISTASYDSVSIAISNSTPHSVFFKNDGSVMYTVGSGNDRIYQYNLSTNWDVSTATVDTNFLLSGSDASPVKCFFRDDGEKMYMVGVSTDTVYQYALTTPWDIDTMSFETGKSFSVASQDVNPFGIHFKDDGTKMFMVGSTSDAVFEYALSTAWDISTASYSSKTLDISSQITVPGDIFFKTDGSQMYIIAGNTNDNRIFQYSVGGERPAQFVTTEGDAQIDTAQSYFGGASGLFDGTADLLKTQSSNFAFGSSDDFTIEGWVRVTTAGNDGMFHLDTDSDYFPEAESGLAIAPRVDNSNWVYYAGAKYTVTSPNTVPALNTWYHVALVRESGTLSFYVDGDREESRSDTNNYTGEYMLIGGYYGSGFLFIGNIDEFRVSTSARYSGATYTVPTSAFVNDSDTVLLLHMNGTDASTDFIDDNGKGRSAVGVSAIGNAQIDTAQSYFGGASGLFDGTGDYLLLNHDLALGSGDWTIETWLRPNDNSNNQAIFDGRPLSTNGAYPLLSFNAGTLRYFVNGTEVLTGTTSLSTGTWYHVAVVKNSGTLKLYVNGSEDDSVADTVTYLSPEYAVVGISGSTRTSIPLNGHLDELRVSTTARYTAGFTAPTESFQNDANTLLLLHCNGTDGDTDFIDDNGTY